jgi:hypothetical protein
MAWTLEFDPASSGRYSTTLYYTGVLLSPYRLVGCNAIGAHPAMDCVISSQSSNWIRTPPKLLSISCEGLFLEQNGRSFPLVVPKINSAASFT